MNEVIYLRKKCFFFHRNPVSIAEINLLNLKRGNVHEQYFALVNPFPWFLEIPELPQRVISGVKLGLVLIYVVPHDLGHCTR